MDGQRAVCAGVLMAKEGGWLASSAQDHQGDGRASSHARFEHGHRAVCGGGFLDAVDLEAVVEVVQCRTCKQRDHRARQGAPAT